MVFFVACGKASLTEKQSEPCAVRGGKIRAFYLKKNPKHILPPFKYTSASTVRVCAISLHD